MASCAAYRRRGDYYVENQRPLERCKGYVVMPVSEYTATGAQPQLDQQVFSTVTTALLLSFVTGHVAGRIVRWLNKT